jgi:transcriptional regulator with XRE-family HTH domain
MQETIHASRPLAQRKIFLHAYGMAMVSTPGEILAGNVAATRVRRRLQQQDLADRMRVLGWKWVRQTVGEVENGRRRLTAEEVFALSVALETSIPALMAPVDDDRAIVFPSGLEISATAIKMLAQGLTNIGATWYGDNKVVLNVPAASVERFRQVFGDSAPHAEES